MRNLLMTKELLKKLPKLYATEETPEMEKTAIVKFFSPYSNWRWFAVEYDPVEKTFYGLVMGHEEEWGYFSLSEFEEINRKSFVPKIERDLYFSPTKMADVVAEYGRK